MINGYSLLKLVHVLLAIVAVGYNASYGLILGRAARAPRDTQKFVLQTIRALDRIANWAYLLLLLTGGGLMAIAHYRWGQLWTGGSTLLLVVGLGLAHGRYTPILKKQILALDESGPDSAAYQALSRQGARVGTLLLAVSLLIVTLMVLKPAL